MNHVSRTHDELNRSTAALMTYVQEGPQIAAANEVRHLRSHLNEHFLKLEQGLRSIKGAVQEIMKNQQGLQHRIQQLEKEVTDKEDLSFSEALDFVEKQDSDQNSQDLVSTPE